MKKFIQICKAILPQFFRVAHWHLSFRWLQTAYFPMFVSLKSHAIKHVHGLMHRYMQHQTMYNLTHNQCLSYMYLSANATSAVHKRICNA